MQKLPATGGGGADGMGGRAHKKLTQHGQKTCERFIGIKGSKAAPSRGWNETLCTSSSKGNSVGHVCTGIHWYFTEILTLTQERFHERQTNRQTKKLMHMKKTSTRSLQIISKGYVSLSACHIKYVYNN